MVGMGQPAIILGPIWMGWASGYEITWSPEYGPRLGVATWWGGANGPKIRIRPNPDSGESLETQYSPPTWNTRYQTCPASKVRKLSELDSWLIQ